MRFLLFALWLAVLALLFLGCRKPSSRTSIPYDTMTSSAFASSGEQVISDGVVTCELRRDQFGHTYEKSNIPLDRCFGIWLQENGSSDHYEQWFHRNYGDPLSQEGRKQAEKHLLGRT